MKCPDCGAANPAGAKFCGDCGHQIQAPKAEGGSSWDSVFKWIGIAVVGLFVLGLLSSM